MKKCVFMIIVASLILGLSTIYAQPVMEISEMEFNFGFAPQHAKVSHVFWLRSVGEDTLRIKEVIPGCGCTQAPLEKSVIAPGDSARLEVIFATRDYHGNVKKAPQILTNNGKPPTRVMFYSRVTPRPDSTYPIVIMPYKLDISQRARQAGDEVVFQVQNVSDQPVTFSVVAQPEGFFDIELPASVGIGETAPVTVKVNQPALEQSWDKSITFELNDSAKTRYTIPLSREAWEAKK